MKTIVTAKISRQELITILFAARWQMLDWKNKNITDIWDEAIKATKYLENYMKDNPADNYYIENQLFHL